MATAEQLAQIPGPGRGLYRIWTQLPTEPLSESAIHEAILSVTGHYAGDHAWASVMRSSLLTAEALTVRKDESGQLLYERTSEFPIHPPNHPGSESFNRQLEKQAQWEREQHAERDRAVQAAAENGPHGQQRREMLALIDERFDERIQELARELDRPTVERLREALRKRRRQLLAA